MVCSVNQDIMADLLELPFHFLRVPNLKLRIPNISAPSATTVFFLVLASYYLVFSGIIYDVIVEPPSIGSHRDEGGSVKPVVFLQYRINGQYIIEGLAAGLLFVLGGVGIIILNKVGSCFCLGVALTNNPHTKKLKQTEKLFNFFIYCRRTRRMPLKVIATCL